MSLSMEKSTSLVDSILYTYGDDDLSQYSNFQGGYINFGYWKKIHFQSADIISMNQRIQSSIDLYNLVLDQIDIQADDVVAEVGCGRGLGCARVLLNHSVKNVFGFDISPDQINRAKLANKTFQHNEKLIFQVSPAENLKADNHSIDKLYAVESAQHYPSMRGFAEEAMRVLKPQGKLSLAAHFSTSELGLKRMEKKGWIMKEGIDNLVPIDQVVEAFKLAGFADISVEKIGLDVFPGYEKWLVQNKDSKPWARNLFKSFEAGFMDYYLVTCCKS